MLQKKNRPEERPFILSTGCLLQHQTFGDDDQIVLLGPGQFNIPLVSTFKRWTKSGEC